jgi:hypothetical protein
MDIWKFFNSQFFSSLSTLLTVGGAVYLYSRQQKREKEQISRLLVNEIRQAETSIQLLKERDSKALDLPNIFVLQQNNWHKYSHLFTKDLDQDEINLINKFYSDAERIGYLTNYGNEVELFLLETRQKSYAIQHKIVDILEKSNQQNAQKDVNDFTDKLDKGLYHYCPRGYNDKIDKLLANINFILNTSAGLKLKKISKIDKQ